MKEREKKAKCFPVGCLKLMLRFTEKGKIGWASCCETWLKFKSKFTIAEKKKRNQGFLFNGFVPTGWAPCCE